MSFGRKYVGVETELVKTKVSDKEVIKKNDKGSCFFKATVTFRTADGTLLKASSESVRKQEAKHMAAKQLLDEHFDIRGISIGRNAPTALITSPTGNDVFASKMRLKKYLAVCLMFFSRHLILNFPVTAEFKNPSASAEANDQTPLVAPIVAVPDFTEVNATSSSDADNQTSSVAPVLTPIVAVPVFTESNATASADSDHQTANVARSSFESWQDSRVASLLQFSKPAKRPRLALKPFRQVLVSPESKPQEVPADFPDYPVVPPKVKRGYSHFYKTKSFDEEEDFIYPGSFSGSFMTPSKANAGELEYGDENLVSEKVSCVESIDVTCPVIRLTGLTKSPVVVPETPPEKQLKPPTFQTGPRRRLNYLLDACKDT